MSEADPFDLAVIGGGINGAGIARDAAGRGARVVLLEAGDLACGTSSKSTKLIHGGLRYLGHFEFGLVHEALVERETLIGIAPHVIHPMRFILPHTRGLKPPWLLRAGLFLYDHIGGRTSLPGTDTVNLLRHPAGGVLQFGHTIGFEYSDAWVDDARLVVLNAMDVRRLGGEVRTRTAVTSARRESDVWRIETTAGPYFARALANAAGPSVNLVEERLGRTPAFAMRNVRGSHIVVPKLFDHGYAYFFQLSDGRIFFAIPYEREFTLIGTTDADHDGPLDRIEASAEEIAYLCTGANGYFRQQIAPKDVVWSYAGVRPLIDDGSGKPESATRGYRLDVTEPGEGAPLLSVYGGKITTYRHLGEEAVDMLAERLPSLGGPHWTGKSALPGGDFPVDGLDALKAELAARFSWLDEHNSDRIARAYGTIAERWLRYDPGRRFGAGLTEAEIDYLKREEWAVTSEDLLWRRTKLGLHMSEAEREEVAGVMRD